VGRGTRLLYVLLLVAILVGVVAALLVAASPSPPPARPGQVVVDLPPSVWGLLFLSPLLVGLGGLLYRSVTEPTSHVAKRTLAVFVVLLLLAVVFIWTFAAGGFGGGGLLTVGPGPGNLTSPPHNNTTTPPSGNNTTNVSQGYLPPSGITVARLTAADLVWVVLGVTVLVGALAVPGVLAVLLDRRPRSRGGGAPLRRAEVRAALAAAQSEITAGGDPRESVVRLYARLLAAIGPKTGDVSCLTAEEIRAQALSALGVRPAAAQALTRLFEEARYSAHPFGPSEAGRFRDALRDAEVDLLRGFAS
jgi:hypothetical protein